jgi:hypothetical protein
MIPITDPCMARPTAANQPIARTALDKAKCSNRNIEPVWNDAEAKIGPDQRPAEQVKS